MANYPFDYFTSKTRKDGSRSHENPYTLHIVSGVQVLERPPGSGHFFNSDGSPMQAEDVPGAVGQPKLKVPAKDQEVDASVPQNVSTKEGNVIKVSQEEAPAEAIFNKDKRK